MLLNVIQRFESSKIGGFMYFSFDFNLKGLAIFLTLFVAPQRCVELFGISRIAKWVTVFSIN